ncbi:MAG: lamin tail domain-containing protein [Candidatus Marinimicrobia bacterium]|nr:lamin tail domain-containing protein [FCB group bacterium]MBL7024923.1 lamin tail domain-containing protein [Candidatus Neomarinimicrobiota bacterium]
MKRITIQSIFFLLMPYLAMAVDHLLINEIVLQPSAGEYIRITNPSSSTINLSDYYLTDATDTTTGKYYYNLPSGADYWSGGSTDFIARFPDTTISAGGSLILGLGRTIDYVTTYGSSPHLSLKDDMLNAVDGVTTIGGSPNVKLDNVAETLVLFSWDGTSTTVKDVEYLIWGTDNASAAVYMLDKRDVAGYLADTPVTSQSYMTTHTDGFKLIRNSLEGTETSSGGNGITGHDETSENLAHTWSVVDLTIVKPTISNIVATPSDPETTEDIIITADVTDASGLSTVTLTYTFPSATGSPTSVAMTATGANSYTVTIPATNAAGTMAYYIVAVNTSGLSRTSSIKGITIADPPPPVTIQTIRDNFSSYSGTIVNLNVVVAIGSGITRTDRTEAYVQDESGYGIVLSATGLLNPALVQGDSINLVGEVSEYNGTKQIINFSSTSLATGRPVPGIRTITSAELAADANQGSFVKVWGAVQSRSDGVGGGSNVGLEDADGLLTVRIWDTTHLLDDPTADSLLQVGNLVQVFGIASQYNGDGQLLAAYASDIQPYQEGEESEGGTSLTVAPYPFVPQLAEKIQYTYKFPANSRVTLRIFDMSGHIVTTLFEDYRSLALEVTKTWNGRNEIYQVVAPGTYIMHLETVNRSTGEILTDMAPVVIGSR